LTEGGWYRVGDAADFDPGTLRGILAAGHRLCVGRTAAVGDTPPDWFAISDTCPHAGGSLSEGMMDGREVICPLHAWGFDVATGQSPEDPNCLLTLYPVRVADGAIEVQLVPPPTPGRTP